VTARYQLPARSRHQLPHSRLVHACQHSIDADLDALIRVGRGNVPLVNLRWRCENCRSHLTNFVMTGSHFGSASRADLGKIGS
jgi:hypothetical protein